MAFDSDTARKTYKGIRMGGNIVGGVGAIWLGGTAGKLIADGIGGIADFTIEFSDMTKEEKDRLTGASSSASPEQPPEKKGLDKTVDAISSLKRAMDPETGATEETSKAHS